MNKKVKLMNSLSRDFDCLDDLFTKRAHYFSYRTYKGGSLVYKIFNFNSHFDNLIRIKRDFRGLKDYEIN